MRIACKEQKTHEWYQARLAKVTASNISRAMAKLSRASGEKKKGDWAAAHDSYVRDIAWELITRVPTDHYVSKAMDIGTAYEGEARIEYWQAVGEEVEQTGFVLHPTIDFLGCSPDGLRTGRGVEIKVPMLKTHEDYLMDDVVPAEYQPQMQCNMLCCTLPEWDFVSYAPPDVYPDFPDDLRLFIKPLKADPVIHAEMEAAAIATMEEAAAVVQRLLERYPSLTQPQQARTPVRASESDYDHTQDFTSNCAFIGDEVPTP